MTKCKTNLRRMSYEATKKKKKKKNNKYKKN